jgi:HK97 family phage portal protein
MPFWSNWFGGATTQDRYVDDWLRGIEPGLLSATGLTVTVANALSVPGISACIQVQSEDLAKVPLELKRRTDSGYEPATEHDLYALLKHGPAPWLAPYKWRKALAHGVMAQGNHYSRVRRSERGKIERIAPIQVGNCTIRWADDGEPFFDIRSQTGMERGLSWQDVIHVAYRDTNDGAVNGGVIGVSPILQNKETVALMIAAERFAAAFFGNGAQPSMILEYDKKLPDDEVAKRIRAGIERAYSGLDNKWKVAILELGMKMKEFGGDATKSQLIETRKYGAEQACTMYRTPQHKIGIMDKATFCLPAEAMVSTEVGPKPIAEIEVGEKVWSLGADGAFSLKPVLRSGCTGESPILTIKVRGRTLKCNAQHRVLVRRQVLEPFKGGGGQCVAVDGTRYRRAWRNVYVAAGTIVVGDKLLAVDSLPSLQGSHAPTRVATVEFMELLGHLIGDGFYFRNPRGARSRSGFGISHAANDDCSPHYVRAAESVFAEVARFSHGRPASNLALKAVERDPNTTVFYSVAACAELEACGVVGTAKTKRVPAWIFGLRQELQLAFLRGYLDSDGTVNRIGQIRFVSCNKGLLEDVSQLCAMVGIRCGEVFTTMRRSAFEGYADTTSALHGLELSNPLANSRIGSNDPMRRDRLAAATAKMRTRSVHMFANEAKQRNAGVGMRGTAVVSIGISNDAQPVYDLCVADNHSFVANGVVVHNSNIEQESINYVTGPISALAKSVESAITIACLTPAEREVYKIEHNLEGLMRGDILSRYRAYAIGRQWGWLSVNKILNRENENEIGESGDEYLSPLNMVPAGEDPMKDDNSPQEQKPAPNAPQNASIGWSPTLFGSFNPKKMNGHAPAKLPASRPSSLVAPNGDPLRIH